MTFEEFASARLDVLFRFASVLTGDRGLAEDVVQEVLSRAFRQWPKIAETANPDAYIRRMIVNEFLSWRRKWARIVPMAHIELAPDDAPDMATHHANQDSLSIGLATLPPRQLVAVVMRFYAGADDAEIAVAMGCRAVTVRGYISRALRTLRVEMADSPDIEAGFELSGPPRET